MGMSLWVKDNATRAGVPRGTDSSLHFQPLNPDDLKEIAELRRQRLLCGWGFDSIDKWLDMIRKGDRVSHSEPFAFPLRSNEFIPCIARSVLAEYMYLLFAADVLDRRR